MSAHLATQCDVATTSVINVTREQRRPTSPLEVMRAPISQPPLADVVSPLNERTALTLLPRLAATNYHIDLTGEHQNLPAPALTLVRGTVEHPADPPATHSRAREAHHFATVSLPLILQVLDRRRGVNSLMTIMALGMPDTVGAIAVRHRCGTLMGNSSLRKVNVQQHISPRRCEVWGTYTKGGRVFAFAGRVHLKRHDRWMWESFTVG